MEMTLLITELKFKIMTFITEASWVTPGRAVTHTSVPGGEIGARGSDPHGRLDSTVWPRAKACQERKAGWHRP